MDLQSVFQDASTSFSQAVTDFSNTGVPALTASVEQYGAQQLQKLATQNQNAATAGVTAITKRPVAPGSFGATFGSMFGGIGQNVVFQQYGPLILIGGVLVVYLIIRK